MDHKIWYYLISSDKIFPRKPCQHPDLLAALQRTGSFVSNTLTQQVIRELKCFFVLHNAVAVGYHTQNSIIGAADIGAIAGDHSTRAGIDITALHLPIQTGQFQGFTACRGIHDDTAKAVPWGFTDREHRFNIVCLVSGSQRIRPAAFPAATSRPRGQWRASKSPAPPAAGRGYRCSAGPADNQSQAGQADR